MLSDFERDLYSGLIPLVEEIENQNSRRRVIRAFSELDYTICIEMFADTPACLAPNSVSSTDMAR